MNTGQIEVLRHHNILPPPARLFFPAVFALDLHRMLQGAPPAAPSTALAPGETLHGQILDLDASTSPTIVYILLAAARRLICSASGQGHNIILFTLRLAGRRR
jgi:hypothetical protein